MASKIDTFFTRSVAGRLEKTRLFKKFGKKTWLGIALVLILAIGGGITYFQIKASETQTAKNETLQTTITRKNSPAGR